MASGISRFYRAPAARVPLIISGALGLVAVIGQTVLLDSSDSDSFSLGMFSVLLINAVIAIVLVLRADPYASPAVADERTTKAFSEAIGQATAGLILAIVVQIVAGVVQSLIFMAVTGSDDWTLVALPLLAAGLVGSIGACLGLVAGLVVVWPIIKLVDVGARKASGRATVPGVAPLSVLLITTVVTAIFTVLAPHTETIGTPRGRGLALLIGVWFNYSGSLQDHVFSWIARGLQLVIVGLIVWLAHDLRAAKKPSAT